MVMLRQTVQQFALQSVKAGQYKHMDPAVPYVKKVLVLIKYIFKYTYITED